MNARTSLLVLSLSLLSAACYRTHRHAAPPPPPQQLPRVHMGGAPGPGLGRVVLDVADGPAVVEEVHGGSIGATAGTSRFSGSLQYAERVCVTPCVLDTKPGAHQLRFTLVDDDTRTSTGFVNVDQQVSAYRHSIGVDRSAAWKGFVGWPLLVGGAILDLGAVAAFSDGGEIRGGEIGLAAFSVGITALGAWLVHGSVVDKQPGSGTQWYPE